MSEPTILNLLNREGAICVTFKPALELGQSEQLIGVANESETLQDLEAQIRQLAKQWGRELLIDPVSN